MANLHPSSLNIGYTNTLKTVGFALLYAIATSCNATCWGDAALSSQAFQVARETLPELKFVPPVSVCTPNEFSGAITGLYHGGSNEIWIHQAHAATPNTKNLLIHELAHALIQQQYGPQSFAGGHGPEWMKLMVRIGKVDDARLHANVFPEAMQGFQNAVETTKGFNRNPQLVEKTVRNVEPNGTTISMAEMQLHSLSCAQVLMVPAGGGTHGYDLGMHFRSFTMLPTASERIRSIKWVRRGVLELEVRPTPDGTPSLMCLG